MSVRRSSAFTVTFFAIDPANRPTRKTGVTFSAGDVKVSQDGGAFSNTGSLPTEIGSSGRYSLPLTAAEMNGGWIHVYVGNSQMDPSDLVMGTDGSPAGTIQASGGNTASTFLTDRTESTDSYWNYCLIAFTTGTLAGQVQKVIAYSGSTKFITVQSPFTGAPSAGDRFILINI